MIEPTKTEVVPVNRGDIALSPNVVNYAKIRNSKLFSGNVRPGDVIDRKNKSANFAYFWYSQRDDEASQEELEQLKDVGYFFVNVKDFEVKRWTEAPDGRIKNGGKLLMALPEAKFIELDRARLTALGAILDAEASSFHSEADNSGFGTFETRGGKSRDVVKPTKSIKL
jgi:hypothetical protein